MRRIILILLLILLTLLNGFDLGCEDLGLLDQIYQPQGLVVLADQVIVAQKSDFFVFQLKNLRQVRRFGNEGEGPGEMTSLAFMPNTLMETEDYLLGESMTKIIGFAKADFKVVMEEKKGKMAWNFMPLGDHYVFSQFSPNSGEKVDINLVLMTGDRKGSRVLYRQSTLDRDKEIIMLRDVIIYGVMNNCLYVEKSDQAFIIDVYDQSGKPVRRIEHPNFKRASVTERMKEIQMDLLKSDPLIGMITKQNGGWENFKKVTTFTFPERLPVIRDLLVKDDTIFALTYTADDRTCLLVRMEKKGRILRQVQVPFTPSPFFSANSLGKIIRLWDVYKDYYYYLDYIEDDDAWALKRIKL